ncbi:MAG: hypothetical protein MPJ50_07715 [Pirellulales bacterium]|nr:hypothetical protein [Pirellulales bacterium]
MIDPSHAVARKIRRSGRYSLEAYNFLLEAMEYAREELGMGREAASQMPPGESPAQIAARTQGQKHVTGQQLCEATRLYALRQFGHMAHCVFRNWGIQSTSDIGEIVFNMIELNVMLKTPDDRREDFDDVFDLQQGLRFDFSKALRDVELAS